ncbi:unnamed protein product [Arctogadus glacialis]
MAASMDYNQNRFGFKALEPLCEDEPVCVDAQHVCAQAGDQGQAALPEGVPAGLHQEGLDGVGDLVAQVGVGQVEAAEDAGLKLRLRGDIRVHRSCTAGTRTPGWPG